jgi:hypothetical protein
MLVRRVHGMARIMASGAIVPMRVRAGPLPPSRPLFVLHATSAREGGFLYGYCNSSMT